MTGRTRRPFLRMWTCQSEQKKGKGKIHQKTGPTSCLNVCEAGRIPSPKGARRSMESYDKPGTLSDKVHIISDNRRPVLKGRPTLADEKS